MSSIFLIYSCSNEKSASFDPNIIEGCMDQTAFNYVATTGDVFIDINTSNEQMCIPVIYGCIDSTAYNYSIEANTYDGSCIESIYGCMDNDYVEFNEKSYR